MKEEARKSKVILIGIEAASGQNDDARWDCVAWDTPADNLNLHDYDRWVLFTPSLPNSIDSETIYDLLAMDYVHEALSHNTRIFVLGDPTGEIYVRGMGTAPFLHWTGYRFDWKMVGGDTLYVRDDAKEFDLRGYLTSLKNWHYAMRAAYPHEFFAKSQASQAAQRLLQTFRMVKTSLAKNRLGEDVSCALRFLTGKQSPYDEDVRDIVSRSEHIVLVPLRQDDPRRALISILKDTLGISLAEEAPVWIESMVAPGQGRLDDAISRLKPKLTSAMQCSPVSARNGCRPDNA